MLSVMAINIGNGIVNLSYRKIIGQTGFFSLTKVNQSRKRKTEFKPVILCSKIDLVLLPVNGGEVG